MAIPVNAVVDLSHHNSQADFAAASSAGVLGVIHKATQGVGGIDPTYKDRRLAAESAGLLWGAYHFGTGSDGVSQAKFFLDTIGDASKTLLVLDLEGNPTGPSMSLVEARAFVTHLADQTGRWPGLYSGHYVKELLGAHTDSVLNRCWFWLAQYGPTAVVPSNWESWTMWQYTDGAHGLDPHAVPGIGHCDRDLFNGAEEDLRAFWAAQSG